MWHRASTCTCWRSQVSRPTPSKSLQVSPGPQVTGLYLLHKISPRILLCNRDPRLVKDIDSLENIQRRSARFTVQDYSRYISVSALLKGLDWSPLKTAGDIHLTFLFKIVKGKVAVQAEDSLAAADSRSRKRHDHKLRHCVCTEQFLPRFLPEWNSLPDSCVKVVTVATFKEQLRRTPLLLGSMACWLIQPPFIAKLWSDHTWPGFESLFSLGSRRKLCWFNHMPVKKE